MIIPDVAITLTQPWASFVALLEKTIETRSWGTKYTGPIAIHAAKGMPDDARELCYQEPFASVLEKHGLTQGTLPRGAIIATCTIEKCFRFPEANMERLLRADPTYPPNEYDFGDFTAGRYGLVLRNVVPLATPVPARGMLSIWRIPRPVREQLELAKAA